MIALKPNPARYQGKTIMVVGAHHVQEPGIRTAKALGLKVVAVDYDSKAPGLQWADYPLLISTTDVVACIEAAREYKVDGVMTVASDKAACTVAAVSEALNQPGVPAEVAKNSTNKLAIRQIMAAHKVPSPRFVVCRNHTEAVKALNITGLPVVVKPLDSNSSCGVMVVNTISELDKALEWAAQFTGSEYILLEEFIQGDDLAAQAFVVDGKVTLVAAFLKDDKAPLPYRGTISTAFPLLSKEAEDLVLEVVTRAITAMGITSGPVHSDVILSPDGPRLLELTPRLPGLYTSSHLIPLALGINYIQATIDLCLGYTPDLTPKYRKGVSRRYIVPQPGIVQKIPNIEDYVYKELIEAKLYIKPGDVVSEYYSPVVGSGYVIACCATGEEAKESARRICDEITNRIVIK